MSAPGPHPPHPRRRRLLPWVLVALFVVVPLVEIYTLIQVGQVIGVWWTIGLLVLDSIIGGWLVKREGARTFEALRTALGSGRMPARELADAALVLVAGTLMLTPGFVSDVLGLLLVLPVTRPVARRGLTALVTRRLLAGTRFPGGFPGGMTGGTTGGAGPFGPRAPRAQERPGPGPEGPVVRGEVVDEPEGPTP
ncbi:MAG: FxsA family protein [Nocardioides sp.]|nr:FxsA family protein [Nocardioides sp.]